VVSSSHLRIDESGVEPELVDALFTMVEAARSVPRDQRQPILTFISAISHNVMLSHPGISKEHPGIYPADLEELHNAGLIRINRKGSWQTIDVTSAGFREYERQRTRRAEPTERVEEATRSYVDAAGFRQRHQKAFAKWRTAEELLWRSDSETDFSAIGHYCREAAQDFATSLLSLYPTPSAATEPEKSKQRVAAVLRARRTGSSRIDALADSLLEFWNAVIDLTQRQEHGSNKGDDPLRWEDGRRVVFLTMTAAAEIDRVMIQATTTTPAA